MAIADALRSRSERPRVSDDRAEAITETPSRLRERRKRSAPGPNRIKIPPRQWFADRGVNIPGYVWRNPPFKLDPPAFSPSSEKLARRIIEPETQIESHRRWVNGPHDHPLLKHGIYGVGAEPSDDSALYFAAHLVHTWLTATDRPISDIHWLSFGSEPDFKLGDSILQGHRNCDLLVLSNLTPNSSAFRLQRARDLLAVTRSYPAIVVIAGEDPISFFASRLYAPINALFFQTSKRIVRRVEII